MHEVQAIPAASQLAIGGALRSATRWLLMAFLVSVPLEYSFILPGVGSVTRLVGIVLFLVVLLEQVVNGDTRRTPVPFVVLLVFVLWSLVSIVWSAEVALTLVRAVTYLQLLLMIWVCWQYLDEERHLSTALQCFVAGTWVVAAIVIKDFRSVNLAALVVTDLRVSAFGQNPNETGLTLVVGLPMALLLLRGSRLQSWRLVNGGYVLVGSVATLLTASRGAVAALAIAVAMMITFMPGRNGRRAGAIVGMLVLLAVAGGVAYMLIPGYTWERLASIVTNLQRMDFNNRSENWQAGLYMFTQQPLLGVGAGAFEGATAHLLAVPRSSHSTWLGVLVETGLVGACLWLSAVITMVAELRHAARDVRWALLSAIVPMSVGMAVLGWDHRKVPWLLFCFCLCAAHVSIVRRQVVR